MSSVSYSTQPLVTNLALLGFIWLLTGGLIVFVICQLLNLFFIAAKPY